MLPETGKRHFHGADVGKGRSPPAAFAQHPAEKGENWEKPQGLGFSALEWKKTVTETLVGTRESL